MNLADDKLWIALDLDDVVLDFVAGILETVNRDFGSDLTPDDINDWRFGQFIDEIIGKPWFEWLEEHSWLWAQKFKPVKGAIGGIEKLRRAGHYVEIVTTKPVWAEDATWEWLARYKPRVHRLTLVPMEGKEKHELTDADLLIDDKFENCEAWAADMRPALLYNRPHNLNYRNVPTGVVRVSDWNEILTVIENGWVEWPVEVDSTEWVKYDPTREPFA